MVDILVPGTGAGVRPATASVKTVSTESGPQQIIVIPQMLRISKYWYIPLMGLSALPCLAGS